MKKGLLLSVVASGLIYAGGDIAPVAPVAPQAAPAACDFYGSIGARFQTAGISDNLFKKASSSLTTIVDLGIETQLGYGFGVGAEVAAMLVTNDFKKATETAELSQLYLTYKYGNTAVKAGRQALPKTLSPWAWTDSTLNMKATTFEGVVVVNTDLPDTVLVGAWIARAGDGSAFGRVNGKDNLGLFAGAVQYTGIANTTLRGTLYYVTKPAKVLSAWASAETKLDAANLGLQVGYVKPDAGTKSYAVAGYIGTSFNGLNVKLTGAYADVAAGSPLTVSGTAAVWGEGLVRSFDAKVDNNSAGKAKLVRLDADYKLSTGTVYAGIGYETEAKDLGAIVGYKFNLKGVNAKVEYRYQKADSDADATHRIRVEGVYKF